MANPFDIVTRNGGMETNPNDLDVQGSPLSVARNCILNRDGMIERRKGFKDYSTNLPDFTPEQLFESGGVLYLNLDDGLWYFDTGTQTWSRKAGSIVSVFSAIGGIWVDASETYAYVSDYANHAIFRLELSNGKITLIAGLPGTSGTANGTGQAARFNQPKGIWGDGTNLYVCDRSNFAIRKIVISTGAVTTFAGLIGTAAHTNNAVGTSARFQSPYGMASDGTNLYVTEVADGYVRKITIGGTQTVTDVTSGLFVPRGIWCASAATTGYLVTDIGTSSLRSINLSSGATSLISTYAAHGSSGFDINSSDGGITVWAQGASLGTYTVTRINTLTSTVTNFSSSGSGSKYGVWSFDNEKIFLCSDNSGAQLSVFYASTGQIYVLAGSSASGGVSGITQGIIQGPPE